MNKEFERYLILLLVLVLISLSGCVKKHSTINKNPKLPDGVVSPKEGKKVTVLDSVGRMQGVANALVCVFAPDTCEATKQEREMSR
tara:strand:- start:139 stop:396 length:258 start_codon:yes stop_codon:yes gene_type:complete